MVQGLAPDALRHPLFEFERFPEVDKRPLRDPEIDSYFFPR